MARIVGGFASSYSPQLNLQPDAWNEMARRDFEVLEITQELDPCARRDAPAFDARTSHLRCQEYLANLGSRFVKVSTDVLIILAEDEQGLVESCSKTSVLVFAGGEVPYHFGEMPPQTAWAYGEQPRTFVGSPVPAERLAAELAAVGISTSRAESLPEGASIGHHVGFLHNRILRGRLPAILPVLLNSKRLPSPCDAFKIGATLRQAVGRLPEDLRVGAAAIGGLSHIRIDEMLDRRVLKACASGAIDDLAVLPNDGGTASHSHNRPWIALTAMMSGFQMNLLGYEAAYRSSMGTGCGMAFAVWE